MARPAPQFARGDASNTSLTRKRLDLYLLDTYEVVYLRRDHVTLAMADPSCSGVVDPDVAARSRVPPLLVTLGMLGQ